MNETEASQLATGKATAKCPNISDCAMYPLFKLAGSLAIWKMNYSEADYTKCARYARSSLGQSVPTYLLPNGKLLRSKGDT